MPMKVDRPKSRPHERAPQALLLGLALLSGSACAATSGVSFSGKAAPPVTTPEAVVEVTRFPLTVERLGTATAECSPPENWQEAFRGRSLVDVDCTERRLRRMLRESAAQNGANLLAGLRCESGSRSRCSAAFGRGALVGNAAAKARVPSEGRPGLAPGAPFDVRGMSGTDVRVDFDPVVKDPARPPREDEAVRELPSLPPSHFVLGTFVTECEECSELETRDALRLAAGSLGASDVVGVRCQPFGTGGYSVVGYRCLGSAAASLTGE